MAHPKLFLASFVVVLALSASSVAAADCPPKQVFEGRLPLGSDLVITYTLPVTSQRSYIQFNPEICNPQFTNSWFTMYANGNSIAGSCSVGMGLTGTAGTYTATVNSKFYGQENSVPIKYSFWVTQKNC